MLLVFIKAKGLTDEFGNALITVSTVGVRASESIASRPRPAASLHVPPKRDARPAGHDPPAGSAAATSESGGADPAARRRPGIRPHQARAAPARRTGADAPWTPSGRPVLHAP